MNIEPVAYFHSPLTSKFGIPRQGGLAKSLSGQIVFDYPYRHAEAVRGLEQFSYLWLIWEFSANRRTHTSDSLDFEENAENPTNVHSLHRLTVRPPRLGGNERIGVFASRSPFRPNRLGLTCVSIDKVEMHPSLGPVIHVFGADLMDGTPIYDVKPYIRYADCHPDAVSGFVDRKEWKPLDVQIPDELKSRINDVETLREVLSFDPRPQYHHDAQRVYGMPFAGLNVRFRVENGVVYVLEIV